MVLGSQAGIQSVCARVRVCVCVCIHLPSPRRKTRKGGEKEKEKRLLVCPSGYFWLLPFLWLDYGETETWPPILLTSLSFHPPIFSLLTNSPPHPPFHIKSSFLPPPVSQSVRPSLPGNVFFSSLPIVHFSQKHTKNPPGGRWGAKKSNCIKYSWRGEK